jgi:hypothetical protein
MNQDDMNTRGRMSSPRSILFHPDYTVGPGVSPDLLTPSVKAARGL